MQSLSGCVIDEVWQTLPAYPPMPEPASSGYAPVNDIRMYYAVYGQGEPLILLHGGLAHSDVWSNQVPALARYFKVIVADSRGHGRSTRSAAPYSYQLMASDTLALMDHLEIGQASILGWSDGGVIALDIAMTDPGRVNRLVVFGANYSSSGLREDMSENAIFNKYIENAGKDYRRLSQTPGDYEAFLAQIGAMWNTQPNYTPQQLGTITAPTLVVGSEHDESIRREHTEDMARMIPGATLLILHGVSHFAFWQKPHEYNQAALSFLLPSSTRPTGESNP